MKAILGELLLILTVLCGLVKRENISEKQMTKINIESEHYNIIHNTEVKSMAFVTLTGCSTTKPQQIQNLKEVLTLQNMQLMNI